MDRLALTLSLERARKGLSLYLTPEEIYKLYRESNEVRGSYFSDQYPNHKYLTRRNLLKNIRKRIYGSGLRYQVVSFLYHAYSVLKLMQILRLRSLNVRVPAKPDKVRKNVQLTHGIERLRSEYAEKEEAEDLETMLVNFRIPIVFKLKAFSRCIHLKHYDLRGELNNLIAEFFYGNLRGEKFFLEEGGDPFNQAIVYAVSKNFNEIIFTRSIPCFLDFYFFSNVTLVTNNRISYSWLKKRNSDVRYVSYLQNPRGRTAVSRSCEDGTKKIIGICPEFQEPWKNEDVRIQALTNLISNLKMVPGIEVVVSIHPQDSDLRRLLSKVEVKIRSTSSFYAWLSEIDILITGWSSCYFQAKQQGRECVMYTSFNTGPEHDYLQHGEDFVMSDQIVDWVQRRLQT